jgi:hypothetical protein
MCTRLPPDTGQMRRDGRKSKPRSRRGLKPDGRTAGARRLKALIAAYSKDLGELSQVDQALVRTAATITLKLELVEADLASGKPVDSDELIRLASTSRRALPAVTAKAIPDAGQNPLQAYLATRAAAASAVDIDGEADDGDDEEETEA